MDLIISLPAPDDYVGSGCSAVSRCQLSAVVGRPPSLQQRRPHSSSAGNAPAFCVGIVCCLQIVCCRRHRRQRRWYKHHRQGLASLGELFEALLVGSEEPCPNPILEGNFRPVTEEQTVADLEIVGQLPEGFPVGMYVRNGPNPYFPPVSARGDRFGSSVHNWFEGDAMLHAVSLNPDGQITYRNRYIRTKHLMREIAAGRRLFRPVMDVSPAAMLANMLCNAVRNGDFFKSVANTAVISHAGRLLCLYESSPPMQVDMHSLETLGPLELNSDMLGSKVPQRAFTAHPKVDPATGELFFFGYNASEPFCTVGVLDPKGKLVESVVPGGFELGSLMHDFAITANFIVLMDFALTQDPDRLGRNEPIFQWEGKGSRPCRFGLLPRAALDSEVRWFTINPCYGFHVVNAFEEPGSIRIQAMVCRTGNVMSLTETFGENWRENVFDRGSDYHNRLREWVLDLHTGTVNECDLSDDTVWPEFPTIHPGFVGRQNRFAYSVDFDVEKSRRIGGTWTRALLKWDFGDGSSSRPAVFAHCLDPGMSGGEGSFVPRPGGVHEDDGWLVFFVYEKRSDTSELRIVDCSSAAVFTGEPCARIRLPCRVPFGFHGCFVPERGHEVGAGGAGINGASPPK